MDCELLFNRWDGFYVDIDLIPEFPHAVEVGLSAGIAQNWLYLTVLQQCLIAIIKCDIYLKL